MSFYFNGDEVNDPHFNGSIVNSVYFNGELAWLRDEGGTDLVPPSNLQASNRTHADRVLLSWNKNMSVGFTEIYRNGIIIATVNTSTFTDYSVNSYQCYIYSIRNILDGEVSDFAPGAEGCTRADSPGKVLNLLASNGTYSDRIVLTWDRPIYATDDTHYILYRSGSILASFVDVFTYDDLDVIPGVPYTYRVKACFSADILCGELSDEATGIAGDTDDGILPPNNFEASDGTSTSNITITWSHPLDLNTPAKYELKSGSDIIATLDYPTNNYTYNTLEVGTDILFTCLSIDEFGNRSSQVSDTGHAGVPRVIGTSATEGTIDGGVRVTWNSIIGSNVLYRVYRYDTSTGGTGTFIGSTDGTQMDYATTDSKDQYYGVVAIGNNGNGYEGQESVRSLGYPLIGAGSFTATTHLQERIEFSWSSTAGETYDVYDGTDRILINASPGVGKDYPGGYESCEFKVRTNGISDSNTACGAASGPTPSGVVEVTQDSVIGNTETISGSGVDYEFTVPVNTTSLSLCQIGGGGGGGATEEISQSTATGGGFRGIIDSRIISVSAGDKLIIKIGAGGLGRKVTSGSGFPGGATTIGVYRVEGGAGGLTCSNCISANFPGAGETAPSNCYGNFRHGVKFTSNHRHMYGGEAGFANGADGNWDGRNATKGSGGGGGMHKGTGGGSGGPGLIKIEWGQNINVTEPKEF